jgi:ribonucleoside-diphosphate reductase alpha chain
MTRKSIPKKTSKKIKNVFENKISFIKKRDGRIVPFDQKKITEAIRKAFLVAREEDGAVTLKISNEVVKKLNEFYSGKIPNIEQIQDVVIDTLKKSGAEDVAQEYSDYRKKRTEIREAKWYLIDKDTKIKLTPNAVKVLESRYLRKDENGKIIETPSQMFRRVAQNIASAEKVYKPTISDDEIFEIGAKFYKMMANLEFLPNSPTLMNAGAPLQQLSACFVLPIEDSMESIFEAVKNTAIIHQCLTRETRVMTNEGLVNIDQVKNKTSVLTDEGVFLVDGVHKNGKQEVYQLETEHGFLIEGTKKHKFLIVSENGDYIWKEMSELKKGDWTVLKSGEWLGQATDLPKFDYSSKQGRNKTSFKAKLYPLPFQLTPELAQLVGFYMGDGSNHRDGIRFSVGKDNFDIIEKIRDLSKTIFGADIVSVSRCKNGSFEASLLSVQIKEWFDFLGFLKESSLKAFIPRLILGGSEATIGGFLRGLFTADGCIRKSGHITLSTASEKFSKDVQTTLMYLGIPTRRNHYKHSFDKKSPSKEIYQISICTHQGFVNFRKKIGFFSEFKQERLNKIDENKIFTRGEIIPNKRYALKNWYATLPFGSKASVQKYYDRIVNRNLDFSELTYQKVKGVLLKNIEHPAFFEELVEEDFFFTKIKSVKFSGIKEVFDLTVPHKHSYLANGFISHNSGGGTGFSFSRLRPKNDRVKSTSGIASGPISFMTVFDKATEVIKQGGKRRGANMGILRVDHPDILEFINCKDKEGFLQNFNISVALTDDFMRAVEKGESYSLINPRSGEVVRKLDARNIFNLISEHAWMSGDPGIVFIDRMNDSKTNPTPKLGRIESTNPCAEQPLLPYESCNLGSINVSRMLKIKNGKYEIDWEKLKETIRWAVRFLDNVVEMNNYPLPQISAMSRGNRRIGLGLMGFADALIKMEISYKSSAALKFAEKLMKFIDDEADKMSQDLAEIRGVFPNYKDSLYDMSGGPKMRNVTTTTIAPTGTIGIIAGCSQGIEPIFALAYIRLSYIGNDPDKPVELLETNPLLEEVAKREKFMSEDLMKNVALNGSLQKVGGVPAKWKKIFITAHDLTPLEHVKIQAAFQKYTDCAVSKTINFPNDAKVEDVREAYWLAYKLGCKGITIYRSGSKQLQVLNVGNKKDVKKENVQEENVSPELANPEPNIAEIIPGSCPTCNI